LQVFEALKKITIKINGKRILSMLLLPKQLDGGMLIHERKTMEKLFKSMSVFLIKIYIDPFKALILLMN